MIKKYTLLASVAAVLGTAMPASAQTTMDAAMKIQALLDQFSGIRAELKQAQSSINVETMLGNLQGNYKDVLKNAAGTIMDPNKKATAEEVSALVVPGGIKSKLDDTEASAKWLRENMHPKKDATEEEKGEIRRKADQFQYITDMMSYGKAAAIRKKLDKSLKSVEKLRQEAENTTAETDLQNQNNKLLLLKKEQLEITQMLKAIDQQMIAIKRTNSSELVNQE